MTKKIIYIILINILIISSINSQSITWQKLINSSGGNYDEGEDVCLSKDNNIYVCGFQWGNPYDAYVLKLNSNGDTIWTRRINHNNSNTKAFSVAETLDSGCVITGSSLYDYCTKFDKNGNLLWSKNYGNESVINWEIITTNDKGYILCGRINWQGLITKIDSSGNLKWKKIISTNFRKDLKSIINAENGYIAVGYAEENKFINQGYTIKVNENGGIVWEKYFTENLTFQSIRNIQNNYLIGGNYDKMSLLKINEQGDSLALYKINTLNPSTLYNIDVANANRYLITSDTDTSTGRNARVVVTDSTGNVIHQKVFFVSDYSLLRSVYAMPNGDILLAGRAFINIQTGRDVYVVRADSNLFSKPVGINTISSTIPINFILNQNYPNPFNPVSTIKFDVPYSSNVKIMIYDLLGREVKTLLNEKLTAGSYETTFDGSSFSSGIYYYKLQTGDFNQVRKMVLVK